MAPFEDQLVEELLDGGHLHADEPGKGGSNTRVTSRHLRRRSNFFGRTVRIQRTQDRQGVRDFASLLTCDLPLFRSIARSINSTPDRTSSR